MRLQKNLKKAAINFVMSVRPFITYLYTCDDYDDDDDNNNNNSKVNQSPLQVWSGPEGSRKLGFADFMTTT